MSREEPFHNYPYLTGEEFTEACHHLGSRYCQATLGPVRRQWRLRVCTALNTSFAQFGPDYNTYIQIIRPLENNNGLDDDYLALYLDSLSFDDPHNMKTETSEIEADREMIEAEEADDEVMIKHQLEGQYLSNTLSTQQQQQNPPSQQHTNPGYVTYEIHLHPTYQAPCLWFSLHDLPVDEPAFNIDTIFRRLVPDQYKDGLRSAVGAIGGISADHHPITGIPSFFIHPCLLGEAMSTFDCSTETYLMVWLGLVGGCVGLWVPKEMALESPEG